MTASTTSGDSSVTRRRFGIPALFTSTSIAAQLVVGAAGERLDGVEIGQVDRPRAGLGRVLAQALEHVTQTVLAARADADGRAALPRIPRRARRRSRTMLR